MIHNAKQLSQLENNHHSTVIRFDMRKEIEMNSALKALSALALNNSDASRILVLNAGREQDNRVFDSFPSQESASIKPTIQRGDVVMV